MPAKTQATLLNGVTSTGAGTGIDALEYNCFAFYINASSVTTGGTVKIQTLSPAGDWVDLSETAVTADGDTLVTKDGAFLQVRANVTARTDGTYTVTMEAKEGRINEAATSAESVVSTTDLVSFWKLDEASGTRADSHGSNSLTDNNTTGQGVGVVYANAADFERDNLEYLSITDAAQTGLDFSGDFSFIAWVNQESENAISTVFSKWGDTGVDSDHSYHLIYVQSSDQFRFSVHNGTSPTHVYNTPTVTTANWYFIYCYYDSTAQEIGISVDDGTVYTTSFTSSVKNSAKDFSIGRIDDAVNHHMHDGLIGPLACWSRVLSSAEVTALANKDDPFYDQF